MAWAVDCWGTWTKVRPRCLDAWRIYARIGNRRVIANTAVVFDGAILLFTDSAVFGEEKTFVRVEKEGYGILVG